MTYLERIRKLRLVCPIINRAYSSCPDEETAIQAALLAHYEHTNSLMKKLVDLTMEPRPVKLRIKCPECGRRHGVIKK